MTRRAGAPGTGPVIVAGVVGVGLALAAATLPYLAFLARPDLLSLVSGLTMLACGLVLVRARAAGPAGWLVVAASYSWFVPSLAVGGPAPLDTALRCTALLHVAFLSHAVVVVGSARVHGSLERLSVAIGYAAALSAIVGGYPVALPAAGAVLSVTVLRTGRRLSRPVRSWRASAGLVLGLGLVVDAGLRTFLGTRAEAWASVAHPVEVGLAAVLVAVAGTRPPAWGAIEIGGDGLGSLTTVLAAELGAPDLGVALSDGADGWLTPDGEPRAAPAVLASFEVLDPTGTPCAVLEGSVAPPLPPAVVSLLRLAATNAQLRRSILDQVDELAASRLRLLAAADSERAALGQQLRARVIGPVASIERDLGHRPALAPARDRAATTRRALEAVARGFDPVGADGSLRRALDRIAASATCPVVIERCDEPRDRAIARALWFCSAEAVTNTSKHGAGSGATLRIDVRRHGTVLHALLTDDGPGGAQATGAGLRGLADRVETLGGTFGLATSASGTTLSIALPDADENCGYPQQELAAGADPFSHEDSYRRSHRLLGGTS